jgi:hypothetical protein
MFEESQARYSLCAVPLREENISAHERGENCVMRSFIDFILHKILLA